MFKKNNNKKENQHASYDYYTPNQAHQMCSVLPKDGKTGTKKNRWHCLQAKQEIYLPNYMPGWQKRKSTPQLKHTQG